VGWIDIRPGRYSCAIDNGQSRYPLLEFIGLIDHEVGNRDGSAGKQTVKCTRNAAASIALTCAESPYEQARLMLDRLAGFDLTAMSEFRVTDCVGATFVKDVPAEVDSGKVKEMAKKVSGNVLESKVNQIMACDKRDEIIEKALKNGMEGVFYKEYGGPTIKVMYILCDGTGVPGRYKELAGVKGKQADGSAKTFEAKVGAVFVMEYTADGLPLLMKNKMLHRDKRVRYMGTVRKVEDFGRMLHQHAVMNGLADMDAVVFLGDGAKWIWGIQKKYFPYALAGLDLYHSIERVNLMIDLLQFKGQSKAERKQAFADDCIELLRQGKVQEMLALIETMPVKSGNEKKLRGSIGYFRLNMDRMNYGVFTACGIVIGSGVIEAGCKVIVCDRMKNAGMHWVKDHAEKMIGLRCAIRNGEFLGSYLNEGTSSAKMAA